MPYKYPKITQAARLGKKYGAHVTSSQKWPHKIQVVWSDGNRAHTMHAGDRRYEDYLIHGDPQRRANYRKRARGVRLRDGSLAYLDKSRPAFWAYHVLW